jgi:hypothetical protein
MDSDDEMMIHCFMEEEENVTADHLTILAYLLQFQSDELINAAPRRGGSRFGRRNAKERQRVEGHEMIYANYFADRQLHQAPTCGSGLT